MQLDSCFDAKQLKSILTIMKMKMKMKRMGGRNVGLFLLGKDVWILEKVVEIVRISLTIRKV